MKANKYAALWLLSGALLAATWISGTSAHSWQVVACSGKEVGTKGIMVAVKTMALTAIDLFTNADLRAKAQTEFR